MTNRISNWISGRAVSSQKLHTANIEWQGLIILCVAIVFSTSIFSIFAGYNFLASKFIELGQVLSIVVGVVFVVLLESMNILFMSKSMKMFLYRNWLSASFLLVACVMIFSLSFYVSTEGLASWKRSAPRETVTSSVGAIQASYNNRIAALSRDAADIRKNTWRGKLDRDQEKRIVFLGQKVEALEAEKTKAVDVELKRISDLKQSIESVIEVKASKYYNISGVIMIFQFVGNMLLGFFLFHVYREENGIENHFQAVAADFSVRLENFVIQNLVNTQGNIISIIDRNIANGRPAIAQTTPKTEQTTKTKTGQTTPQDTPPQNKETPPAKKSIGYITRLVNTSTSKETEPHVGDDVGGSVGGKNIRRVASLGWGVCPVCGESFRLKTVNQKYCNKGGKHECRDQANQERNGVFSRSV